MTLELLQFFSPTAGKHELSVVVGDVGEIARQQIIQEVNQTNYVEIYIQRTNAGTNKLGCGFIVHTNMGGAI
jgi:hypothetical protein